MEEMKQLTKKQAVNFAKSGIWKEWTNEEIVKFQLFQKRLCMDFSRFHEAIEGVLKRPVFTHEFAFMKLLQEEYLMRKPAPTFEEVINLIPKNKLVVILGK